MATVTNYDFVLEGWQPPATEVISTGWWPEKYEGLPYIWFSAVVRVGEKVLIPEVRCDPCDELAKAPYREMVHGDLAKQIHKALGADKQAARAGAAPPVRSMP